MQEKNKSSLTCWIDDAEPIKEQDFDVMILQMKQQQEKLSESRSARQHSEMMKSMCVLTAWSSFQHNLVSNEAFQH